MAHPRFWERMDAGGTLPPVTTARIEDWQRRHGARLPLLLVRMLMIQDGGCVSGSRGLLWIKPLERFEALAPPRPGRPPGRPNRGEEPPDGEPGRLFHIGSFDLSKLVLDYNVGERPRILWFVGDAPRASKGGSFESFMFYILKRKYLNK